jgi:peptidoglycan/xylan/chitin deacetylase (PgdA/CDA1 family)
MKAGTTMDDGATALGDRSRLRAILRGGPPGRKWSRQPEHRRRRAIALLALAALALLIGVMLLTGGGGGPRQLAPAGSHGFFTRIQTLAGNGPGSFAATELAAENGAINRALARTPYVRVAGSEHREVALTFDDGPGPYTPQILSILQQYNAPATFFEVGVLERYFHASTSEIVARGYAVGDHTFSHAPMSRLSRVDQRAQLLEDARAMTSYGARFPRLFRPPYGLWNAVTLALLHKYRMLMVLWTVDTSDYLRPGTAKIVRSAVTGAKPGAIILMHDAGGNRAETVAALPKIIARLRGRGYRFVTVPRLLLDNPPPANQTFSSLIGSGG